MSFQIIDSILRTIPVRALSRQHERLGAKGGEPAPRHLLVQAHVPEQQLELAAYPAVAVPLQELVHARLQPSLGDSVVGSEYVGLGVRDHVVDGGEAGVGV